MNSKPVFVIATQRSGTNFFRGLLRGTGNFEDFDEILHSEIEEGNPPNYAYFDWSKHSYFKFRASKIAKDLNLSIPFERNVVALFNGYLDALSNASGKKPFFLMDVKYNSLHHFDPVWQPLIAPRFFFELVGRRSCHVLHLVRENYFNTYLSREVVKRTRMFVKLKDESVDIPKITINVEDMLWNIQHIESEVNLVRKNLGCVPHSLEIKYESLASDRTDILTDIAGRLSEFLSVDIAFERSPKAEKIIRDRWAIIANAGEVRTALADSGYLSLA